MTAPVIGLTTYARDERNRFTLFAHYVDGVRRAGGIPILLPPGEERVAPFFGLMQGLLLSGGGDLDPRSYGGATRPEVYNVDGERDRAEAALLREALARKLPTLCICRGMQLANVVLGGTLIEHIEPDGHPEAVAHRAPPREPIRHSVRVAPDSRLAHLLGTEQLEPYSWHHQAIRELAPPLKAVAWAPDGIIEAVEDPARPELVCVQWHPELGEEEVDRRVFGWLVEAARGFKGRKRAGRMSLG